MNFLPIDFEFARVPAVDQLFRALVTNFVAHRLVRGS